MTNSMTLREQTSKANVLKWLALALVTFIGGYAVVLMYAQGETAFALLTLILVASGVVIFAREETYSHRYIYPGMAAMVLFILFPLFIPSVLPLQITVQPIN